jgi:hypothetical protein
MAPTLDQFESLATDEGKKKAKTVFQGLSDAT